MNDELINSAVSFLKDANVSSSPLNKKIEFLESKGLNEQEIEEALKRANGQSSSNQTANQQQLTQPQQQQQTLPSQPPIDYYNVAAPQVPERTWQDYFIMATATAGVTYGLYQVVSKYLIPSIIPPTQKSIDDDKAKIDEEFIKIDKLLEQMSMEQNEIKESNESKLKEIDIVIENVNDFLSKYNKDKLKFDDDLRLMKLEIDNLKNSIEKNMLLTKENIRDELKDINEELTSLKQLIKVRAEKSASNDSAGPSRKIAPVSSIPSASEILKKAKAGSSNDANKPKNSSPTLMSEGSSTGSGAAATTTTSEPPKASTSPKTVVAAGIPEWQLKHKQQEEEEEKNKKSENDTSPPNSDYKPHTDPGTNDDVVKNSLANVGVPSWQLNSNTKSSSKPELNPSDNIPSWQSNAST